MEAMMITHETQHINHSLSMVNLPNLPTTLRNLTLA
jgi:hypothetical protein